MRIIKKVVDQDTSSPRTKAFIAMDLPRSKFDHPDERLTFRVNTYTKLKYNSKDDGWKNIFRPINKFLETLTEEESIILGEMFVDIHTIFTDEFTNINNIIDITGKISNIVQVASDKIKLAEKIQQYVITAKIPIPDLGYAGKKAHHSKEMTFDYEEYIGLTAIVFICKLFCPIFGELIYITKGVLDNSLKETHCITILKLLIGNNFFSISQKFYNYLSSLITPRKPITHTSAFNGYTYDKFALNIYASMLVKKFVNVDIYQRDGNLITYSVTCIRNTMTSLDSNMKKKNSVMERKPPGETGEEEGNSSRLETESFPSRAPVDTPILVKISVERAIRMTIDEYNINQDAYETAVDYYLANPSPITDVNKYLISTFMGHRIGGAYGINMLDASVYMKLIAFTQLYMYNIGLYKLIHALSIIPTDKVKEEFEFVDTKIHMDKGAGYAYRNCKKMFTYNIGNTSWDSKAKDITNFITGRIHLFNTADSIWQLLEEDNCNNRKYTYDEHVIQDMFSFIEHILRNDFQMTEEMV